MEWIVGWILLAIVVGVAGNTRGRSGLGWFLLAVLISPLIAGLLVLALPRLDAPRPAPGPAAHRVEKVDDAQGGVFQPDGIYSGIPYKVRPSGTIDAMMTGGRVRFRDFDQFIAAAHGQTVPHNRAISKS